ncbi:MAG: hypothetical protein JO092_03675, partial [Candidatus Eremiobacteraeota bacterium]|nr:hypothetical protein [Candidatus Eremiobacteraeota bacterium]
DGLARAALELELPFVSGNVSLYNESATGFSIPASAIVACVGAIGNIGATLTPGLKRAGAPLFVIGNAGSSIGGTVYADLLGIENGEVPRTGYDELRAALQLVRSAADAGVLYSCTAVAAGGTLTALARAAFASRTAGRDLGIELSGAATFDETPGFVIEVADEERFLELAGGTPVRRVGVVLQEAHFRFGGEALALDKLYASWSRPLAEVFP